MEDIGKILEAEEYCLTNGKCTECKFSKGRMFTTCRYLMEDAFELLKEQQQIVRCKDCKYCTISAGKKWRQDFGKSIYECDHKGLCYVEPDWFCADGGKAVKCE